jgi:carbonic anhydrase/acetyltransferase-like protein (isoleucine patch superfamily)
MPAVIRPFRGVSPKMAGSVFLADTAAVIGDVELGADASVWFGAVLRGDVGYVRVGARSNIQDLSMLHMTRAVSNTEIGEDVTIGHGVIVHGAKVGSGALIGMGSILLDNCEVGEESVVGAGSLVTIGTKIPRRVLAFGRPAKVVRELDAAEWQQGRMLAAHYVELARAHQAE